MDEAQTNKDEQGVAPLKINKTRHQNLTNHDPNNMEKMRKKDKKKKVKEGLQYDGEVDVKDSEGVEDLRTLGVSEDLKVDERGEKKKKKKKKNKAMEVQFGSNEAQEKTEERDVTEVNDKENINKNNRPNEAGDYDNPASKLEKKKKKKKRREHVITSELVQGQMGELAESVESESKKKKMGSNSDTYNFTILQKGDVPESTEDVSGQSDDCGAKLKRKKLKKKHKGDSSFAHEVGAIHSPAGNTNASHDDAEYASKRKKRKANSQENVPTPNKSNKKVRFSGQDEVFPLPDDSNDQNDQVDGLIRGKRFTKEEDAIIKEAVHGYIDRHNLGEDGLEKVLRNRKHREMLGCWKEIGTALPHRPNKAVYCRAQVLFRRSNKRNWTEEEIKIIVEYQEKHGNKFAELAEELGTHPWHVKDAWRRSKLPNKKTGHWSQEEYQQLFNLVNIDLQMKVHEQKHSKHGMLRDNIGWTAISDQLSTRVQPVCCSKWYSQLTSRMVEVGVWSDVDDYRLLDALYGLDASCIEDVDWDNILENRSADVCLRRWNEMVLHIGRHGNKSFAEQVDVLANRYCPKLIEARETWDNKPRVP